VIVLLVFDSLNQFFFVHVRRNQKVKPKKLKSKPNRANQFVDTYLLIYLNMYV